MKCEPPHIRELMYGRKYMKRGAMLRAPTTRIFKSEESACRNQLMLVCMLYDSAIVARYKLIFVP